MESRCLERGEGGVVVVFVMEVQGGRGCTGGGGDGYCRGEGGGGVTAKVN